MHRRWRRFGRCRLGGLAAGGKASVIQPVRHGGAGFEATEKGRNTTCIFAAHIQGGFGAAIERSAVECDAARLHRGSRPKSATCQGRFTRIRFRPRGPDVRPVAA